MSLLSDTDLKAALTGLPEWAAVDGKLHREYRFADFVQAFSFMTAVALIAESMEHHPDWSNVWNRVTVDLSTHDAGGITAKDVILASKIEAVAGKLLL
ncbi:MAG: 4a-hydroxytetrahydrobiopterin dehydratase [Acidobacteria bacterium]|nr:4a-hydroxytetrahydrobiopterin dehydratase [Acidobacteriota bacterium]